MAIMRIGIVEDEKPLAQALQKSFEIDGYTVDLFFDAVSARHGLIDSRSHYDVIILDLRLPDEDGSSVCRSIRAAGIMTPILVLTARDTTEDRIELLDIGADDFMSKPFSLDELSARVRALSRRVPMRAGTEAVTGNVRIDPTTRSAYRAGIRLSLTAREFELLSYFMHNQGRIIGRSELFKNVWKQDTAVVTNVVDVHVRNLRKKLDDDFDEKYIKTIHGSGYLFAA